MNKNEFITLLNKYRKGQPLSEEETMLLQQIVADEDVAQEALSELLSSEEQVIDYNADRWEPVLKQVLSVDKGIKEQAGMRPIHRIHFLRKWGWVAASVIFAVGIGTYLIYTTQKKDQEIVASNPAPLKNDIAPGHNGAILTLADGTQMVIDSLGDGVIATQQGAQVIKQNGQLTYDLSGNKAGEMVYNIMSTPKGRQFQIILPDGTRVWLNSASSIRYPTAFAGKERKVEVTGEAYFEVAKNTKIPFRVNVNDAAEVEVLGTHFNINGYENESTISTTLLEGSVRVNGTAIKPGQQAQFVNVEVDPNGKLVGQKTRPVIKIINDADIEKAMAWKNGLFNFNGLTFEEIMRQLERWYDIKVVYENNNVPNKRLAGEMTRDVSLNDVLEYLGKMDVRYKLKDRTLIVLP